MIRGLITLAVSLLTLAWAVVFLATIVTGADSGAVVGP